MKKKDDVICEGETSKLNVFQRLGLVIVEVELRKRYGSEVNITFKLEHIVLELGTWRE